MQLLSLVGRANQNSNSRRLPSTRISSFHNPAIEIAQTMPFVARRILMNEFGKLPDGRVAQLYTLSNARGLRVEITNYGGTIVRLLAPDRHGKLADVTLGFDRLEDYIAK